MDYSKEIDIINRVIIESTNINDINKIQQLRLHAVNLIETFLQKRDINYLEYLLIDNKNISLPKHIYIESYFKLGTLHKTIVETAKLQGQSFSIDMYRRSLNSFIHILNIDFENQQALSQIASIFTILCSNESKTENCLKLLEESLMYIPTNAVIHYNMGFIYQKMNNLEKALISYKIALGLNSDEKLSVTIYSGISQIYRSVKRWPECLYYLKKAEKNGNDIDPDIQNQLGICYTEMRRTDLAEIAYKNGIDNYDKSNNPIILLSELYMNFGHMYSYNGNNNKSIDYYNKALKTNSLLYLAFQNKLMNLLYIFDQLEDKKYIYTQHLHVNKLYKKNDIPYDFNKYEYKSINKINIGIVSGDFTHHPVGFFINTFLHYPQNKFNIILYSECAIDINTILNFKLIKGKSTREACDLIYNDNIHILIDLSGMTAFNRLDIFSYKPAPIQISYIGYPYSTGLTEMDYRITDSFCDHPDISQKFYIEKLLFMKDSFLCYDVPSDLPDLKSNNKSQNFITIACFNRLNKITDTVIKQFNYLLVSNEYIKFIFKTKALINNIIKEEFISKFSEKVIDRIMILDCTLTHNDHLFTYNLADIAIDTFPYSGTTTTCEALSMGVPVFSIHDSIYWYHPQNVTCSILENSGLSEYIYKDDKDLLQKIETLIDKDVSYWKTFKQEIRETFINGKVCNKELYMENITELLEYTINKFRSEKCPVFEQNIY